ncbi:interleukin-15 receptor subunit alpha isoform X15 [Trachypithecus francoisi]|uniref:interleukin-15 receptor subunit alpha isoform X15 n=1 Tax=Trachypithecus francoisi TaxID=54180 RepID=UPI00141B387F|nr:interleukin-15 receptor subunit alpha isoform X15 [Trachypithecus francoisi]
MAPRRARGCRTLRLPVLLLLLLHRPPATRGSSNSPASASPVAGITGITCPPPVSVEHADIRVKSYSLYSRERYICNSGFKRKAGTSSLTECVLNKATNIAHWTTPSLKCIRDPLLARQRPAPPFTVTTAGVTPQPESLSSSGKVAISTSTVLLCGLSAMSLLACYIKSSSHSRELTLLTLKWPEELLLLRRDVSPAPGEGAGQMPRVSAPSVLPPLCLSFRS